MHFKNKRIRTRSNLGKYCIEPLHHNPILASFGYKVGIEQRFWEKVRKTGSCWFWLAGKDKNGYGKFTNGRAHRFSWILHRGLIPKGINVLHRCDNPPCVNPDHLWLGTISENAKDAAIKGRLFRGEKHHNHKLSEKGVKEIRKSYVREKTTYRQIAVKFGVCIATVAHVVNRKWWKHV